jgi:hypothetical protein
LPAPAWEPLKVIFVTFPNKKVYLWVRNGRRHPGADFDKAVKGFLRTRVIMAAQEFSSLSGGAAKWVQEYWAR